MANPLTIAIDGPAASGKSTLAQALAQRLGYLYFDTGAMYRAVTLAALRRGLNMADEATLAEVAREVVIDLRPASQTDGRLNDVFMDGEDCTWAIRTKEVDAAVSAVSAFPSVRRALTEQQQRIGRRGAVVMAGRDIGTVVLPGADLKIFLDASLQERAKRRSAALCPDIGIVANARPDRFQSRSGPFAPGGRCHPPEDGWHPQRAGLG